MFSHGLHGSIRVIRGFLCLIDRELDVVAGFRELLVRSVERLDLEAVSSLLQWLVDLERRSVNTFVDVRRCDLVIVRIERELVIRRIRIRIPFELQILRAHR